MMDEAGYDTVYVTMPGFKYDFGVDLTEFCKELGIKSLLEEKGNTY